MCWLGFCLCYVCVVEENVRVIWSMLLHNFVTFICNYDLGPQTDCELNIFSHPVSENRGPV